ncbi:hypothetical protein Tco_1399682 [Tanacetum coccineum]
MWLSIRTLDLYVRICAFEAFLVAFCLGVLAACLSRHLSFGHCVSVTEFCLHCHELTSVDLITMADANINAPKVPVATDSPPTRSDEQILPHNKWVPFWDTIRFDKDKGYSCQLDEQRFYLTKATLRDALQLPQDNNNFTPPPNANTIISFVNELGYLNVVRTLSGVMTNDMYQPWRALATIINLCLTGKTSAFEIPRAPVLQILWGVVNKENIDYAERIWEEFTQFIHSFIEDKINLALYTEGKKKVNPLVILGVRFTKLIINHLQSIHKFHKRPGSPLHLPYEESALGYPGVAKYQRYLAREVVSDDEAPAPKPTKGVKPKTPRNPKPQSTSSQPPKPKHAPAKPQEKKRKLDMDATEAPSPVKRLKADEGVLADKPRFEDEEADIMQKVMEESLKDAYPTPRGPLPPVVIKEPEPRKLQPLQEV